MPAYHLGAVIRDNIAAVAEAIPAHSQIIVVDDGSSDDTFAQASDSDVDGVLVLRHDVNMGKGAALRTGGLAAVNPIVVLLDGDLDLPAEQIGEVLEGFDGFDVLVGVKRHSMSGGRYPIKRRLLSHLFRFITQVLFRLPVSETQTGLKVFRRDLVQKILSDMRTLRYAFDLELLVRAQAAAAVIGETPVSLRVGASSAPLRMSTLWEMGRDTFRILWWTRTGTI